jgi:hypothetical protein
VLMPMSSPLMFRSGPPLFPLLIAASVWIISGNSTTRPSGWGSGRSGAARR